MAGRTARLLPLAAALALVIAVYLPAVSPHAGRGDVAKFQLVGPALGTPHPTGYPLHTLLSHGAVLVAGGLSWPETTNSLSALLVAFAAALVGVGAAGLGARPSVALAVTVGFGASPALRSAAAVAEVYPLHLVLVATVLAALVAYVRAGSGWALALATVATGAAFAHHATAVCLVPAYLVAVLGAPPPGRAGARVATVSVALILAIAPYAYLVERSYAADAPYLEARAHSFAQLEDVATGGPFKGHVGRVGPLALLTQRLPWLVRTALAGGWLLLPVGLAGLLFTRSPGRRSLVWFLIASSIFLALYDVPDLEAYLLAPFVALALAAAPLAERFAAWAERRAGRWAASALLPALALVPLAATAPIEPRETGRAREYAIRAALLEIPKGGALVVLGHEEGLAVELLRHQPPGAPGVGVLIVPREALEAPFLLGPLLRHLAAEAPLRLPPDDRALAPGAPLFLFDPTADELRQLEALGIPMSSREGSPLARFGVPRRERPPLAFVARRLAPAGPVDIALRRLLEPDFDPTATALVRAGRPREAGGGSVRTLETTPDRIRVSATVAAGGGWLVVQENLRSRWTIQVDGVESPSFQVDYGYPAVELGAGEHEVVLARDTRPFALARWFASPWGYLVP